MLDTNTVTAGTDWKTITEIIGAGLALATLLKGTVEYVKQGSQKRTELFLKMRDRYDKFLDICTLLETQDEPESSNNLRMLSFDRKRDFIGFYEEIALMTRSGLIRPAVAHYMFGYYAIRCWESDDFWSSLSGGPNRQSKYWGVFRKFALDMQREERKFAGHKDLRYNDYRL
jgi:hypothetical protein